MLGCQWLGGILSEWILNQPPSPVPQGSWAKRTTGEKSLFCRLGLCPRPLAGPLHQGAGLITIGLKDPFCTHESLLPGYSFQNPTMFIMAFHKDKYASFQVEAGPLQLNVAAMRSSQRRGSRHSSVIPETELFKTGRLLLEREYCTPAFCVQPCS